MDLLNLVREKQKKLKIKGKIYLSDRPDKKLMLVDFDENNPKRKVYFGSSTSTTFIEGASKQKRDAYRARASKIVNKDNEFTYRIPYTSNYLAFNLLW